MKLTTKGRFAVTAMIDLAAQQPALSFSATGFSASSFAPVSLNAIAERQNISLSYLEQLFGKLRRKAIVDSVRGANGGYVLARTANDITVADIILAVDEPLDATSCAGKASCSTGTSGRGGKCMTHDLWETLNSKMLTYLESVSLQDLVAQEQLKKTANLAFNKPQKIIFNKAETKTETKKALAA